MGHLKFVFVWLLLIFTVSLRAQVSSLVDIGGPKYLSKSSSLPEEITTSRSVVVIQVPEKEENFILRGDWKKLAETAHLNLRKIGVDAISYIHNDDLNAGPEVQAAYLKMFSSRNVKNLVYLRKQGELPNEKFTIIVIPLDELGGVAHGQLSWIEESSDLSTLFLRLGRQVLRQNLERGNFLIPEKPEYLEDLAVFSGNRLENYPSRLKSLPLAVITFQKIDAEKIENEDALREIEKYNKDIDQKNDKLKEILSLYPFKYELVEEADNDALYRKGYQYTLMPLSSTGKTIKKMLNFPTSSTETDYMASVYNNRLEKTLLKIPVNANVCKYYIKQTIVKDVHTGDYWDADESWEASLRNFILHMRVAFKLPLEG